MDAFPRPILVAFPRPMLDAFPRPILAAFPRPILAAVFSTTFETHNLTIIQKIKNGVLTKGTIDICLINDRKNYIENRNRPTRSAQTRQYVTNFHLFSKKPYLTLHFPE